MKLSSMLQLIAQAIEQFDDPEIIHVSNPVEYPTEEEGGYTIVEDSAGRQWEIFVMLVK